MHLTRGDRVQRPLTCGPIGWPVGRPHFAASRELLGGEALQEAKEWNPRPGVGGGHAPWPAGHRARPAGQHLASY
jgi:hypothetical protein